MTRSEIPVTTNIATRTTIIKARRSDPVTSPPDCIESEGSVARVEERLRRSVVTGCGQRAPTSPSPHPGREGPTTSRATTPGRPAPRPPRPRRRSRRRSRSRGPHDPTKETVTVPGRATGKVAAYPNELTDVDDRPVGTGQLPVTSRGHGVEDGARLHPTGDARGSGGAEKRRLPSRQRGVDPGHRRCGRGRRPGRAPRGPQGQGGGVDEDVEPPLGDDLAQVDLRRQRPQQVAGRRMEDGVWSPGIEGASVSTTTT